jgi:hypothetical protein
MDTTVFNGPRKQPKIFLFFEANNFFFSVKYPVLLCRYPLSDSTGTAFLCTLVYRSKYGSDLSQQSGPSVKTLVATSLKFISL